MREEFIAISPLGAAALMLSGYMFAQFDLPFFLVGGLCLLVVWENARTPFRSGEFHRRSIIWRRVGDVAEKPKQSGNVVPFGGGGAA